MGNKLAPPGQIWVCAACGKTSPWSYGFDDSGKNCGMPGWDESCSMHAHLVPESDITERTASGRVLKCTGAVHWSEVP